MTWKISRKAKNNFHSNTFCLLLLVLSIIALQGCGVYSFTGAATNAKTISIQEFYNNADLGPANMGQTFTNSIKNYFIQNSSLSVAPAEGELQLEGEIVSFTVGPIAPTANPNNTGLTLASATRVTITVKATYINTLDEKMSFKDKTFSFYQDFNNDQNLSDVEEQFVRVIFERIIIDIFNASVANW